MPPLKNLTGQRFTRLIVIDRAPGLGKKVVWQCRCDCGTVLDVRATDLLCGKHRSCGCLHKDKITKHANYKTPEYSSWLSMKGRCLTPTNLAYPYYGGRGISVCERWKNSFANFLEDMGKRPSILHTLDRIDPNGNYEPSNCRWATKEQQGNNRRDCHYFTIDNRTLSITEWAKEYNQPPDLIRSRVTKLGWDISKALQTPLITRRARDKNGKWV